MSNVPRKERVRMPPDNPPEPEIGLEPFPVKPSTEKDLGILSIKERQIADLAITRPNLTSEQIARRTGTSIGKVETTLASPKTITYLSAQLDEQGADLRAVALAIAQGLKATKKKYFTNWGEIKDMREDPDHEIRLRAAELALKAHGITLDPKAGEERPSEFRQLMDVVNAERARRGLGVIPLTPPPPAAPQ